MHDMQPNLLQMSSMRKQRLVLQREALLVCICPKIAIEVRLLLGTRARLEVIARKHIKWASKEGFIKLGGNPREASKPTLA